MMLTLESIGIRVEVHHHEVATAGQCEIDMRFDTLTRMADKLQMFKYVVKNVARRRGMTATFVALLSAIEILPVALAVLIFFLFPILTSLILAVMGWERLSITTVGAGVHAFAGLMLALGVSRQALSIEGIVYSGIAALGLAIVSAVSGRVIRSGDPRPVTLYILTMASVVAIVIVLVRGAYLVPQSAAGWWGFAGSVVFSGLAIIGFFVAISLIGAARATLFQYAEPLFTMATAFLLLGQLLTPLQVLGAVIVVGALVGENLVRRHGGDASTN